MSKKKNKNPQTYPKCPLCGHEQTEFPPDLFGPCKNCIQLNPSGVKQWREEHKPKAEEISANSGFLKGGRKFSVEKRGDGPIASDSQLFIVEEWESERFSRRFTAKVSQTQAARPQAEEEIALWCQLYPEKLPQNGGTVDINLDYVKIR